MTGITRHRSFWILYAIASAAALFVAVRLFPLAIPIVNLLAPLFGTAFMAHLEKRFAEQDRHASGSRAQ